MKLKHIVIATALATSMTGFAFADDITAESGVYVNGQVGWSFPDAPNISDSDFTGYSNYSYSETPQNFVAGATIGYDYAITQNWMAGVELGYLYMGQNQYSATADGVSSNLTLKNWGIQLMATGTYVMPSGWNVFAKVGGVYESTEANVSGTIPGLTISGSETSASVIPAVAVGAGYLFTQNLNLAFQYEHTFGDNYDDNNTTGMPSDPMTQNIITLGLTYKFPM
jgi:opacity protein-like surface antigen